MSLQVAPVNGTHIHYSQSGPKNGPALIFANSLGTDLRIWDDVARALCAQFNVITYDKRGHGLSGIGDAPYDVALHANDLIGLLDHLGIDQVIICRFVCWWSDCAEGHRTGACTCPWADPV